MVAIGWLLNRVIYQTSLRREASSKGGNWIDPTTLGQEIILLLLRYIAMWQIIKAVEVFWCSK